MPKMTLEQAEKCLEKHKFIPGKSKTVDIKDPERSEIKAACRVVFDAGFTAKK